MKPLLLFPTSFPLICGLELHCLSFSFSVLLNLIPYQGLSIYRIFWLEYSLFPLGSLFFTQLIYYFRSQKWQKCYFPEKPFFIFSYYPLVLFTALIKIYNYSLNYLIILLLFLFCVRLSSLWAGFMFIFFTTVYHYLGQDWHTVGTPKIFEWKNEW